MGAAAREPLEYRSYSLPEDFPVLCLSGAAWEISPRPSRRLHFHSLVELGVCHSWHGTLRLGGDSVPFRAGDVTLIPPYLPHTTWSGEGGKSRWSYLFLPAEGIFLQGPSSAPLSPFPTARAAGEQAPRVFRAADAPGVYPLACDILREFERREPGYRDCALGLLQALAVRLGRLGDGAAPAGRGAGTHPAEILAVLPALDFMERHYAQPIRVSALARLCGLSETHFRRRFGAVFGAAPLAYLNRMRVQKACALLWRSNASVLSVSERTGFATLSSFNRHFKRETGLSPLAWRRAQAERQNHPDILERPGWRSPEEPSV